MKIVILDIESTGLPPKGWDYKTDFILSPYLLSMGWKIVVDDQESQTFEYIINQEGRNVPAEATKINGITQTMCEDSKFNTFTTLLQFMMDAQNADFIIGWNLYFDTSIIKANVLRIIQGGKTPMDMYDNMTNILHKDKRIDLMRVCHKLWGGKWPTLSEAYFKLFGETFKAHSAGSDVEAVYRILQELIRLKVINLVVPEKVTIEEEE